MNEFEIFMQEPEENTSLEVFKEYAIDYESLEPLVGADNDLIVLSENDALKVWIYKALKTERFRYNEIYSDSYGSELAENIGTIYQKSVKDALMINQIKDCLLVNPYIVDCYNFEIDNSNEYEPLIKFTVGTVYGTLEEELKYEE